MRSLLSFGVFVSAVFSISCEQAATTKAAAKAAGVESAEPGSGQATGEFKTYGDSVYKPVLVPGGNVQSCRLTVEVQSLPFGNLLKRVLRCDTKEGNLMQGVEISGETLPVLARGSWLRAERDKETFLQEGGNSLCHQLIEKTDLDNNSKIRMTYVCLQKPEQNGTLIEFTVGEQCHGESQTATVCLSGSMKIYDLLPKLKQ